MFCLHFSVQQVVRPISKLIVLTWPSATNKMCVMQ